jgi:ADP-heptose:LPS heptosyltransferase
MDTHENILLIRLKFIGDILFTLPAVPVIRENFPGAKITFLVSWEHAPLIESFRDVDKVLPLDRGLYRRENPITIAAGTFSLLHRLRQEKCWNRFVRRISRFPPVCHCSSPGG